MSSLRYSPCFPTGSIAEGDVNSLLTTPRMTRSIRKLQGSSSVQIVTAQTSDSRKYQTSHGSRVKTGSASAINVDGDSVMANETIRSRILGKTQARILGVRQSSDRTNPI